MKYWGGGKLVPKAQKKILILIPEMAFAVF
jgi:hypothetical protein